MTNNEPELKMFTAVPVQLTFFYDTVNQEIVFSSSSPDTFFGAPLDILRNPPFPGSFEAKRADLLGAEWQACLQLKENEVKQFTVPTDYPGSPQLFSFTVVKPASSTTINSSLLIVSVTRMRSNDVAKNGPRTFLSPVDKYAEFIELASHDLDSPLRKLSMLLERIASKYDTNTGQDIQGYFLRANACLADLRSMIESLTLLARLNNSSIKLDTCDLNSIIKTAINNPHDLPGEKQVDIRSALLPVVIGDAGQYKQLFGSLLENAFKFRKKATAAEVEIDYVAVTDTEKNAYGLPKNISFIKISISDKGIGFRQEYAQKIFQPFVRLNGKSEYPGNGIGLAISKQIVENHGGIIYAEGEENIGARFILFLPLSPY